MRRTRIYYSGELSTDSTVTLDNNASHHLMRVLRMKAGEHITVFNGGDFEYECELLDGKTRNAAIRVHDKTRCLTTPQLRIHLIQGISRGDRMDLSIQKATELGVTSITPVLCKRSTVNLDIQRANRKHEHWQQIIISACEQSGRCRLASLSPLCEFGQSLQNIKETTKLILDPAASSSLRILEQSTDIALIIGPEGGLEDTEIALAKQHGFTGIKLGPRILRTETAGMACISALQTLWGDLG